MKIEFELDQEQKHIPANRQVHQVVAVVALLLLEVVKNHRDRVRSIQPETIHIPWIHVKIYGAPKNPKTRGAPLFCHQVETIIIPFRYESLFTSQIETWNCSKFLFVYHPENWCSKIFYTTPFLVWLQKETRDTVDFRFVLTCRWLLHVFIYSRPKYKRYSDKDWWISKFLTFLIHLSFWKFFSFWSTFKPCLLESWSGAFSCINQHGETLHSNTLVDQKDSPSSLNVSIYIVLPFLYRNDCNCENVFKLAFKPPEDNTDFTLSLISCHSLSSPKRLAHFRWTSLYLGWSIIIHWKKSLFTSDSLAQLSFKVACFVARGQKYSKFNFSRLSEQNHISIQSGSIWSWIDPFLDGLKYDKILSILNSPVLILYI